MNRVNRVIINNIISEVNKNRQIIKDGQMFDKNILQNY